MSDYPDMPQPPPIDYDDWGALSDDYAYADAPEYDPYPPDDMPPLPRDADLAQMYLDVEAPESTDRQWAWHDARLIGVDRGADAGADRYEIGAIDLYANADTGDIGGSYLPITAFGDETAATARYHDWQAQIHAERLAPYQVSNFAEARAFEMNSEPANWRGAEPVEYAAYEYLRDLEAFDAALADDPPQEAIDPLLQTAMQLGGVLVEPEVEPVVEEEAAFEALNAIGVQAENFDPSADPPPFYDADTGTAYWIGVFQPDKDDRENCVTSILSLGRNPETGAMEAQLAPCVPGDWDKAYSAAEHLIQVAGKGGIEGVFDTAEGMALATDQRDLWDTERGVTLEPEATREIADYTREQWEMEL